jgi:hypothetical protein
MESMFGVSVDFFENHKNAGRGLEMLPLPAFSASDF